MDDCISRQAMIYELSRFAGLLHDDTITRLQMVAMKLPSAQPEIIRCKDCKHRPTYPEAYGAEINGKWCYWCELIHSWKPDDWFCADGERREQDV